MANKNKTLSFKALSQDARFITLSDGNKKLVPNSDTKFLIWNLPAVKTCPFATEHCKKFCYALKAERCYPSAREARERNFKLSLRDDFVERMIFSISAYLAKPSYKKAKTIVVRIHESGDFYNKEYAEKWQEIAKHFLDDVRIVFVAYTKSIPFFDAETVPVNMAIRASIWDDTKPELIALSKKFPIYTAWDVATIADFVKKNRSVICRCDDCATCGMCWNRNIRHITCEIH